MKTDKTLSRRDFIQHSAKLALATAALVVVAAAVVWRTAPSGPAVIGRTLPTTTAAAPSKTAIPAPAPPATFDGTKPEALKPKAESLKE